MSVYDSFMNQSEDPLIRNEQYMRIIEDKLEELATLREDYSKIESVIQQYNQELEKVKENTEKHEQTIVIPPSSIKNTDETEEESIAPALSPRIAALAVSETSDEQKYYDNLEKVQDLALQVPEEYKKRAQKLVNVCEEVYSTRLYLNDVLNIEIPDNFDFDRIGITFKPNNVQFMDVENEVIYLEPPNKPILAKRKELGQIEEDIKSLNQRISDKRAALERYARVYDLNVKCLAAKTISSTLPPNSVSNILKSEEEAKNFASMNKAKAEELKLQIKRLQNEISEKQFENSHDIVTLVNMMKQRKLDEAKLQHKYRSFLSELAALTHCIDLDCENINVIQSNVEKMKKQVSKLQYDTQFYTCPAYLSHIKLRDMELKQQLQKVKSTKETLQYKVSMTKRKIERTNERVPDDLMSNI